jgi:hypothetical protein
VQQHDCSQESAGIYPRQRLNIFAQHDANEWAEENARLEEMDAEDQEAEKEHDEPISELKQAIIDNHEIYMAGFKAGKL